MAQGREPVIVVGGGIGGLAAALALARKGLPSRVLEQAPEFREIGAGIQLGPNVFKMFERLGLTDAVSRIAWFPDRLVLMDCITGKEVTRITLGDDFRAKFKFPYAVIHRADLHQAILQACRDSGLHRARDVAQGDGDPRQRRQCRGDARRRRPCRGRGAHRRGRAVVDRAPASRR